MRWPREPWRRLAGDGARLIAISAVLLGISVAGIGMLLWRLHGQAMAEAVETVDKRRVAISEQTERVLQSVDRVVTILHRNVEAAKPSSPEAFRQAFGTRDAQRELRLRVEGLPQVNAFTLVDATGLLVNFSRGWPIPDVHLSDRDYFRYLQAHDDATSFISAPVYNRGDGGLTFFLARRVNGPGGEFEGIVLAAVELDYLKDFYRALSDNLDMLTTLSRADGTVLTRYPEREQPVSQVLRSSQALPDYPLEVAVAVPAWDVLSGWRQTALIAGLSTAVTVLCLGILLRAQLRQFQRLERSEASLAAQTEALTASRGALSEQSAALEATLAHMDQGILMVGADRRVAVFNQRMLDMMDLPRALMEQRPLFSTVAAYQRSQGEFAGAEQQPVNRSLGQGTMLTEALTYERRRPNGRIVEFQTIPIAGGGMVRTYTDITDRRVSEERIRYFALHDSLTKLANRVVFREQLDKAVELANRSSRSTAVLYMDLDGFKLINDSYGHETGDKLLVEVSERLRHVVRNIDTVARMGGDEFAVIQILVESPQASERLAERIQAAIREPYVIGGVECAVNVSIGIALYPEHADSAEELLRDADVALYRAKAGGKAAYRMFDSAMDRRQQHMFAIEQDLRLALPGNQLMLEYQPIVEAGTLRVRRYEALLRWRHPVDGIVPPGDFVPLAERTGLIVPIGLWALETACRAATRWPPEVELSVNLSPAQFKRGDLPGDLARVLERTGLAPHRLHLEVTEGLMLEDTQVVLGGMARLRDAGVRFSLDDFGTAHAGLTYLRRFPFETLKIDKSFVQDAPDSRETRAIVEAIMAMGAAFGLTMIAEGVETEAQLDFAREAGCAMVQGFLTGRPGVVPMMAQAEGI